MTENEKKVLNFLKTGMVYSDNAICKNIGISQLELENIYESLHKKGYLETYEEFQKREKLFNKMCCKNSSKCNSSCCSSNEKEDYSNIKVLTEKAFTYNF